MKIHYVPLTVLSFCLISMLYASPCFSQATPAFEWAKNFQVYYNGLTLHANYGTAICTDEYANNYTVGYFGGNIHVDTVILSSANQRNFFMVSYDSSGSFRWIRQFTGICTSLSHDIVYDNAGHIYTTGSFSDSISFDGSNYFSINQMHGYYIARFDTTGNFQWAKIFQPNSPSLWYSYIRLSTDNGHNIYATGRFDDTLNIDGNIMNIPVTDNFYFIKFDSSGTTQFLKSGFADNVLNLRISNDIQSHIYITGKVTDSVRIQSATLSGNGMFIAGFDAAGNYKWMNLATGTAVTGAQIQVVDNMLYVAGFYNDSLHLGTTTFYTPTLIHNTFLAQFDTTGTLYWVKRMDVGTGNQIRINSMVAAGNYVYVAGEYTRTLTFNGIQYSATPSIIARDPFVAAYNSSGNEIWFKGAGSFHEDYGYDIAIDNNQNLYLTGATHFPSYFDGIVLVDTIAGTGPNPTDTYIAKIDNNSVLSIPVVSPSSQVVVYPNPLTTHSVIAFSNPHNNIFTLTLTDITGHILETASTVKSEIILTKGNKAAGVYLFILVNEHTGRSMNGKIVVSH